MEFLLRFLQRQPNRRCAMEIRVSGVGLLSLEVQHCSPGFLSYVRHLPTSYIFLLAVDKDGTSVYGDPMCTGDFIST